MDVVVPAVAAVVDATNFITASEASLQAFKTATLLKTLSVNALISGEEGVGKRALASFILPEASVYDASDFDELLLHIENAKELIITNIDNSPNISRVLDAIANSGVRVVVTAKTALHFERVDELFSVQFDIPPLSQRPEDVEALIEMFVTDAQDLFGGTKQIDMEHFQPDLSKNAISLRRQVMIHYLLADINDTELMEIMQNYLYDRIGSNNDYRNFLYLYEAPLIKVGLKKFKSQLRLSDKLGLNRNTLRKKIAENKQYL